jgi:hypothetical protein
VAALRHLPAYTDAFRRRTQKIEAPEAFRTYPGADGKGAAMTPPETRYAKSGDVHIAYQVTGTGPFDLVWVPGFISNVELQWDFPEAPRFISQLASFSRVIRFDKRGTGLSDRVVAAPARISALGRTQPEDHLGRNDRKRRKRSRDFLLHVLNTHQNKTMQEDK